MPRLANSRHEQFARARADGLSRPDAYRKAGYAGAVKNAPRVESRPEVIARVAELPREGLSSRSDIRAVIDELLRLARVAATKDSAACLTAAKGLLSEAAKLQGRLDAESEGPSVGRPRRVVLTTEQWLEKYAPRP
ncbi:MAG: hypothetical protein ABI306_03550 [Caulobacteraceae bacterium]